MKRTIDVIGSVVGLLLTWPLWIVAAVLIKLDSAGPVFFRQTRVGRNRCPFVMFKFRTMAVDAHSKGGQITVGQDARITAVGSDIAEI